MPRVFTYNAHDCVGRDGVYSPARIVEVLRSLDADVVGLQEITLDHAGDLIDYLEAETGMAAVDGTVFDRGVGRYGNLLLSRFPVLDYRLHNLSYGDREPRGLIDAIVEMAGEPCRVAVTHLGLASPERREQLRRLAVLLGDSDERTVLLGDFNVWLTNRPFRALQHVGFAMTRVRSYRTWPLAMLPLDRIMARGALTMSSARRHDTPQTRIASDHFPVGVDLHLRAHSYAH